MSRYQLRQLDLNFTDSRRASPDNTDESSITNYTDTTSIATIKQALQESDPNTYTDEYLGLMNTNDMVFAWRTLKEPKSISDYQ